MSLLDVRDLVGGYGGANILNGVNLNVERGDIVVLVGPNGAGKSTFMKILFGLARHRSGTVEFDGTDISELPSNNLVRIGLSYVPQEKNVFPSLSVRS